MGVFTLLVAVVAVAVKIGLAIFFVDATRRLLLTMEQISKQTTKQTLILNALVSAVSAGNAKTREDT